MERKAEYIEDAIEQTRTRIEGRLGDLADQMSPKRVINKLFRTESESPLDIAENMVQKARDNPIPALMIGAGVAGLILGGRRVTSSRPGYGPAGDLTRSDMASSGDPADRIAENAGHLKRRASEARENLGAAASDFRDTAEAKLSSASETAAGVLDSASEHASKAGEAIAKHSADFSRRAGEAVADIGANVQMSAHRVKHELRQAKLGADSAAVWVRENPIPAGLAALAIGAAAASIFAARQKNGNGLSQTGGLSADAKTAGRGLRREAREQEGADNLKGAERFEDLREAAQDGKSRIPAKARKGSAASASRQPAKTAGKSTKSKSGKRSAAEETATTTPGKPKPTPGSKA